MNYCSSFARAGASNKQNQRAWAPTCLQSGSKG
jgi:hypothetical protein